MGHPPKLTTQIRIVYRIRIFYFIIKKAFFFLLIYVSLSVESKSYVHFRRPEPETHDKNLKFPDHREFPMSADENGYWI